MQPERRPVDPELAKAIDATCAFLASEAESFRPLLDTLDPLAAELRAADLLARVSADPSGPLNLAMGLVAVAARYPEPHVAAMTAALGWLLPGMATSMALGDLTRRGVQLPAWYEQTGEASPARAWCYRDMFGERRAVLVTFHYGDAEHAILVDMLDCPTPQVRQARVSTDVPQLREVAGRTDSDLDGLRIMQEISLEQAAAALAQAGQRPHSDADPETLGFLPIVRRRVEQLPEPEQAAETGHTKADRAGAVEQFLADTEPPPGADRAVLRFWAEVLAGSTATCASPPTRIGPLWLGYVLTHHVPRVFDLTAAQRAGLVPAVTAWASWAAGRQGLPEVARNVLANRVTQIDNEFDAVYANPDLVPIRCYLSDVAATTADGEDLQRAYTLRAQAVPLPHLRPDSSTALLASDPAQRRRILADDAEEWGPEHDDVAPDDWLDALTSVSDQLWREDPPGVAEAVLAHLDGDGPDPNLLDQLAELHIEHTGDPAGYLAAVRTKAAPIE